MGEARRCLNSGAFIKVCFPPLDLLVPVPVAVFITQPQCANKPHMFWFSSYHLSQDKVEISVLPEIHGSLHTNTQHTVAEGGEGIYSPLFSSTLHKTYTKKALHEGFLNMHTLQTQKKKLLRGECVYLQMEWK